MNYEIREANPSDAKAIFSMICELAEYEKMTDDVIGTAEMLHDHLEKEQVFAFLLEADGTPVGFALYFYNYSTFKGRRGLYLEDLYIKPQHRKGGYGKKLLETLIATAKAEHCGRMEWMNHPQKQFIEALKQEISYRTGWECRKIINNG